MGSKENIDGGSANSPDRITSNASGENDNEDSLENVNLNLIAQSSIEDYIKRVTD